MNKQWQKHLEDLGARIVDDCVQSFSTPREEAQAAEQGQVLCDLSCHGMIRASGEECSDFLQGQFTNDLKQVTPQQSQLSAYCSPKGRVLANFRLFLREKDYYLELPRGVLPATLQRLRMFILRSKVILQDASEELCRFGYAGPSSIEELQTLFKSVPAQPDEVTTSGEVTLIRIAGPVPRFELHGTADALIPKWNALASNAQAVGYGVWHGLDVQSGIPMVSAATVDAFVPQMLNLHAINGVSFKKGCYPGQEIVARTQYLGKLKRRLYHLYYPGELALQAGDELFGVDEAGQSVGKVVSSSPAMGGGQELLAVMQDTAFENPIWTAAHDAPIELRDLPYELPE